MSIRIPDSPTDLERLQWERAAEAGDSLAMDPPDRKAARRRLICAADAGYDISPLIGRSYLSRASHWVLRQTSAALRRLE